MPAAAVLGLMYALGGLSAAPPPVPNAANENDSAVVGVMLAREARCAAVATAAGVAVSGVSLVPLVLAGIGKGQVLLLAAQDLRSRVSTWPLAGPPPQRWTQRNDPQVVVAWSLVGVGLSVGINFLPFMLGSVAVANVLLLGSDGFGSHACLGVDDDDAPKSPAVSWWLASSAAVVGVLPVVVVVAVVGAALVAVALGILPPVVPVPGFQDRDLDLAVKRAALLQSAAWPAVYAVMVFGAVGMALPLMSMVPKVALQSSSSVGPAAPEPTATAMRPKLRVRPQGVWVAGARFPRHAEGLLPALVGPVDRVLQTDADAKTALNPQRWRALALVGMGLVGGSVLPGVAALATGMVGGVAAVVVQELLLRQLVSKANTRSWALPLFLPLAVAMTVLTVLAGSAGSAPAIAMLLAGVLMHRSAFMMMHVELEQAAQRYNALADKVPEDGDTAGTPPAPLE